MKRLALYLLVSLVSFVIGVAASDGWRYLTKPAFPFDPINIVVISSTAKSNQRQYQRGVAGLATRGSFITLNSADGLNFTKWTVYYDSPQLANKALEKRLKKAVRIISREVVFGDGTEIGEKVIAVFPGNAVSLLWTENDEMCEVEASSLPEILEYRKDFKR